MATADQERVAELERELARLRREKALDNAAGISFTEFIKALLAGSVGASATILWVMVPAGMAQPADGAPNRLAQHALIGIAVGITPAFMGASRLAVPSWGLFGRRFTRPQSAGLLALGFLIPAICIFLWR
jgi:hypothetical protein